jgi:hypothetical protein
MLQLANLKNVAIGITLFDLIILKNKLLVLFDILQLILFYNIIHVIQ